MCVYVYIYIYMYIHNMCIYIYIYIYIYTYPEPHAQLSTTRLRARARRTACTDGTSAIAQRRNLASPELCAKTRECFPCETGIEPGLAPLSSAVPTGTRSSSTASTTRRSVTQGEQSSRGKESPGRQISRAFPLAQVN